MEEDEQQNEEKNTGNLTCPRCGLRILEEVCPHCGTPIIAKADDEDEEYDRRESRGGRAH